MKNTLFFLECILLVPFASILLACSQQYQTNYDSLFAVAEKAATQGNWDYARTIYESVDEAELSEEQRMKRTIGIGRAYFYLERPQKAVLYFRQALAADRASANVQYELANLHYVSSLYGAGESLDSAKLYVHSAAKLAIVKNDLACLNQCYYRIGSIHQVEGNADSSRWYFEKALQYALISQDTSGMARSYTHLALEYKNDAKYDSSIRFDMKAIELARDKKERFALAFYLGNLAETYLELGKTDTAYELILEAVVHADMLENNLLAGRTYLTAAELYHRLQDDAKALQYYEKAKHAGQRGNYRFYLETAQEKLSALKSAM